MNFIHFLYRPLLKFVDFRNFFILICIINVIKSVYTVENGPNYQNIDDTAPDEISTYQNKGPRRYYVNQWAVRFFDGTAENEVEFLAKKHGFVNLGRIIANYYLFLFPRIRRRSTRSAKYFKYSLNREPKVISADQQIAKKRVKRDFVYSNKNPNAPRPSSLANFQILSRDDPVDIQKIEQECIQRYPNNAIWCRSQSISTYSHEPNDPEWKNMWYMNHMSLSYDHNVKEAWLLGITGKDVVVTILDDGLEITHPDIKSNYDRRASYDVNDRDDDPTPRYESGNENKHGTRCAGEVAAVFNNSICVVGVAHNAKIGGIKMLDGDVTDMVEAASLSHNRQHVDIYSASWGPDDDGKSLDGPAKLAALAFKHGVELGRGGKGSIFVWASGNGKESDSCNCDGYTNSIYTLTISSATERGEVPWYSEACSSTLATTYSSGSPGERMIVTTDLHHTCTDKHTGTSASAPLAAGICALALEANPRLTWRDMQHVVLRTAKPDRLKAPDWRTNGVGRRVSHSFGYGLMDAGALVKLARRWTGVPEQKMCVVPFNKPREIREGSTIIEPMEVDSCSKHDHTEVVYAEHVQVRITMTINGRRGDIQIFLTSPAGTRSTLLSKRANDSSKSGFKDWAFMTVHNWGETISGTWKLEIQNDGYAVAQLVHWDLVLYGTTEPVGDFGVRTPDDPAASQSQASDPKCCSWTLFNLCAGCVDNYVLYQNTCMEKCPDQYYASEADTQILDPISNVVDPLTNGQQCLKRICRACPNFCATCQSEEDQVCQKCIENFELMPGGQCIHSNDLSPAGHRLRAMFNHGKSRGNSTKSKFYRQNQQGLIIGASLLGVFGCIFLVSLCYFINQLFKTARARPELNPIHNSAEKKRWAIWWRNWVIRKPAGTSVVVVEAPQLRPMAMDPVPEIRHAESRM